MNLVNIAKGWANVATHQNLELILERLAVCDVCPHKRQLSPAGQLLITVFNSEANTFYCALCGCPLAAKTSVATEKCPEGAWNAKETSYY